MTTDVMRLGPKNMGEGHKCTKVHPSAECKAAANVTIQNYHHLGNSFISFLVGQGGVCQASPCGQPDQSWRITARPDMSIYTFV